MNHKRFTRTTQKILIILLLLAPYLSFSQQNDSTDIDEFIAKQVSDYKIPGLAIGIIKNHKVIFKKGYGVTSTSKGLPVNTQTIFPISSCTKAFTAAALGILVDEGKIKWDDKVVKYLPNFKLSDPWITKELTIVDILSHRSGLKTFDGDLLWYGTKYTREDIAKLIRYSPIRTNFRTDFAYQNIMYLVAGLVVESVTGKTWDEFLKERIFKPLKMSGTITNRDSITSESNFALPHIQNKPIKPLNMHNISPAGGVDSNIDDMLTWMQMWLANGRANDTTILNDGTIKTITSIKTLTSDNKDDGYGLGWFIKQTKNGKMVNHNGGMPGYISSVVLFPDSSSGIVILTNKISQINDQLVKEIANYMTKKDTFNWKEADKDMSGKATVFDWDKKRKPQPKKSDVIPNFNRYQGEYEDLAYGKARIRKEKGKPFLELLPTKELFSGFLYNIDADRFKIVFNDPFVQEGEVVFTRDNNKKITGFKLNIDSDDFLFSDLDFDKTP
ncbi:serine hydrolase [Pedobacter foliorum]|uniref:serine hydrolase n=1 Tax=Pedobacter foliorum TaxID=2739058 RepID=UPI001564C4F7|nr:serine hydrolase [Pedobacter foliorum]NRF41179.1 serine hydrolase [Pedobacter foliorum]